MLMVALLIGSYVAAYFWRGRLIDFADSAESNYVRLYANPWEAQAFRPAAFVEGLLTRRKVSTGPVNFFVQ